MPADTEELSDKEEVSNIMSSLAMWDLEHANLVGFHAAGSAQDNAVGSWFRGDASGDAQAEKAREELDYILWWARIELEYILWWAGGLPFNKHEAELRPSAMDTLEQVAEKMKEYPMLGFEVHCYTGALEPQQALDLSSSRACAVREALRQAGVPNSIWPLGKGYCDQVGPRVELKPACLRRDDAEEDEDDDMLEPWMYKAKAEASCSRAEESRSSAAQAMLAPHEASLGEVSVDRQASRQSLEDDTLPSWSHISEMLDSLVELLVTSETPLPSPPTEVCRRRWPSSRSLEHSASLPEPARLDGLWICTSTWGLSAFLADHGFSLLQRLAAERAPWPTWEFRQKGDTFEFINTTFLGVLREEIKVGGPVYKSVDGFGQELSSRAFWEGHVLVVERDGPQGRFREERWLQDEQLHFVLRALEADKESSWGRMFTRK